MMIKVLLLTPNEQDVNKKIEVGGFEFKYNGKSVLRVFAEANSLEIQSKFEALKKYLFDNIVEIKSNNDNQARKYIVNEINKNAKLVADSVAGTESQCNLGSRKFLESLTGDKVLYPKSLGGLVEGEGRANDVADFLASNSIKKGEEQKFKEITFNEAIKKCTEGYLVMTAYKKDGATGHVNFLLSEIGCKGDWYINGADEDPLKADLPNVFDTGEGKRWPDGNTATSQSLNYAYGKAKHQLVKFYIYLK
jgi:hypothetical protein